jgi:hypothetical protein
VNSLLRRVAKHLRYRPLPELIGTTVIIESAEAAPNAVGEVLATACLLPLRVLEPQQPWRTISLAKYRILDLTFAANSIDWKPEDNLGTSTLKQLRFAVHPDEVPEAERQSVKEHEDPTCLTELAADLDKHQTILKAFLQALPRQDLLDYIKDTMRAGRGHLFFESGIGVMEALLENFFPHEMVITDACLTNADLVWFHKHSYL